MSWFSFFRRRRADAEVQSKIESYSEEEASENVALANAALMTVEAANDGSRVPFRRRSTTMRSLASFTVSILPKLRNKVAGN